MEITIIHNRNTRYSLQVIYNEVSYNVIYDTHNDRIDINPIPHDSDCDDITNEVTDFIYRELVVR